MARHSFRCSTSTALEATGRLPTLAIQSNGSRAEKSPSPRSPGVICNCRMKPPGLIFSCWHFYLLQVVRRAKATLSLSCLTELLA
jgi:hypothetical protein